MNSGRLFTAWNVGGGEGFPIVENNSTLSKETSRLRRNIVVMPTNFAAGLRRACISNLIGTRILDDRACVIAYIYLHSKL